MDDTDKKNLSPVPVAPSTIKLNLIPKGNVAPDKAPVAPPIAVATPIAATPAKAAFDDSSTVQLRRPPAVAFEVASAAPAVVVAAEDTSTKSIARPKAPVQAENADAAKSVIKLTAKSDDNTSTVKLKTAPKLDDSSQTVKLTATPVTPLPKKIELTPATAKVEAKVADAPAPALEVEDKKAIKTELKMKSETKEEKATPPRLKSDMAKLQGEDTPRTSNAQIVITVLVLLLVLYAAAVTSIQFLNFSNGVVFGQKLIETPIEIPGFLVGK